MKKNYLNSEFNSISYDSTIFKTNTILEQLLIKYMKSSNDKLAATIIEKQEQNLNSYYKNSDKVNKSLLADFQNKVDTIKYNYSLTKYKNDTTFISCRNIDELQNKVGKLETKIQDWIVKETNNTKIIKVEDTLAQSKINYLYQNSRPIKKAKFDYIYLKSKK